MNEEWIGRMHVWMHEWLNESAPMGVYWAVKQKARPGPTVKSALVGQGPTGADVIVGPP